MICLENIHVIFNSGTPLETHVLRGTHGKIETGEFVTMIGGNGAGKSTLMNVLSGDVSPMRGRIFLDNIDVTKQSTEERSALVSRVFQNPMEGTCPNLSIEENMALAYRRGQKRGFQLALDSERRKLFKESVRELGLGLEHRMKDPIGALSGGQRQALSLLMAILQPAKILLLDEHTAALDPKMAKIILALTEKLVAQHQLTALMITHSMQQALHVGTRTLLLHEGRVLKDIQGPERAQMSPADLHALFDDE